MAEAKSVFISYSSKDKKLVGKIIKLLDQAGVSYWIAPDMIPVGSNYAREIPRAIRECEMFLLILSKESQESVWVEKEVDSAICCKRNIVPVKIDETPMNDIFSFYLNNVQMIPYFSGEMEAFQALWEQLQPLVNKRSQKNALAASEQPKHDTKKATDKNVQKKDKTSETKKEEDVLSARAWKAGDSSSARVGNAGANADQFTRLIRQSNQRNGKKIGTDAEEKEIYTVGPRMRQEGLSLNRVPVDCQFCGGKVEKIGRGIYRCKECEKENYDYFQTVRLYLERFGATPALIIEKETGVPRKAIEQFLRQEYLEIPRQSPIRMSCENCGAPIRTGYLCDQCKKAKGFMPNYGKSGSWRSTREQ